MEYSVGILTMTVFFLVFDFFEISKDGNLSFKDVFIASVSFLVLNSLVLWFANKFFFKTNFLDIWIVSLKTTLLIFLICCPFFLLKKLLKR
ncbi:hypothetical protein CLV27_0413 [Phorcysia thermohydrogeniphila]|uniref:Uncharacterized protein n=1 Tax=Phorcysia thermohydrogeniphila TaxID=936138 RepID=A0A4R1GHU7_9BACT|nr:hypothetical protein CLV27_0413 [Phorcysia thermohydrogeniphila]